MENRVGWDPNDLKTTFEVHGRERAIYWKQGEETLPSELVDRFNELTARFHEPMVAQSVSRDAAWSWFIRAAMGSQEANNRLASKDRSASWIRFDDRLRWWDGHGWRDIFARLGERTPETANASRLPSSGWYWDEDGVERPWDGRKWADQFDPDWTVIQFGTKGEEHLEIESWNHFHRVVLVMGLRGASMIGVSSYSFRLVRIFRFHDHYSVCVHLPDSNWLEEVTHSERGLRLPTVAILLPEDTHLAEEALRPASSQVLEYEDALKVAEHWMTFEELPHGFESQPLAWTPLKREHRPASTLEAIQQLEREQQDSSQQAPAPVAKYEQPSPLPYGVGHQGAEALAAEWVRYLGAADACQTSYSADGGIDIESAAYVAQVKNYVGSVSVNEVREIFGVSSQMGKQALFFTSGKYTVDATNFANAVKMPLFVYHAEEGTLSSANNYAEIVLERGL